MFHYKLQKRASTLYRALS